MLPTVGIDNPVWRAISLMVTDNPHSSNNVIISLNNVITRGKYDFHRRDLTDRCHCAYLNVEPPQIRSKYRTRSQSVTAASNALTS